jgi:hypothetical protein
VAATYLRPVRGHEISSPFALATPLSNRFRLETLFFQWCSFGEIFWVPYVASGAMYGGLLRKGVLMRAKLLLRSTT